MAREVRDTLPVRGSFCGIPVCNNIDELVADVAIIGIPFEEGCGLRSYTGRKWGPRAIRDIEMARYYNYSGPEGSPIGRENEAQGWFDIDDGEWKLRGVTMADCGDVNYKPMWGEGNCDTMTRVLRKILDRGAFPVVVGGDHTITAPVVRAFDKYDPLDIVHFDAHLDWSDVHAPEVRFYDGSPIKRCSEYPFVHNITQIGINSFFHLDKEKSEAYDLAVKYGANIITAKKFRQIGASQVVESIPKAKNIYVTIDVDVMDAAIVPGTTAMTPGGLSFLEVEEVLFGIPERGRVVGFDVNCFIPDRDPSGITVRLVVILILDFLAAIFPSKV